MIFTPETSHPVSKYECKTTPRQHQAWATSYFLKNEMTGAMMDASPGTGKTKIGIDIAANLYLQEKIDLCLIFGPSPEGYVQWITDEIPTHCPVPHKGWYYRAQNWNRKYTKEEINSWREGDELKFVSFNYETLSLESGRNRVKEIFKGYFPERTLLIFDESHFIDNPKASMTKWALSLSNSCKYVIDLTGTKVGNDPFGLWSQYELLQKGFWGKDYFLFKYRYGLFVKKKGNGRTYPALIEKRDRGYIQALKNQGYNATEIADKTGFRDDVVQYVLAHPTQTSPYRNMEELKNKIAPLTFIIDKDICLDLPEKTYKKISVELSKEQKTAYNNLVKHYMAEYEGQTLSLDVKVVLDTRLRQIAGGFFPSNDVGEEAKLTPFKENPKLEGLIAHLKSQPDLHKIIVSAIFIAEGNAIKNRIQKEFPSYSIELFNGTVSSKRKTEIRSAYQHGELDILVGHPKSIGTGLNLQCGNRMYKYSRGWELRQDIQLEDRIHRDGMKGTAWYGTLFAKGTTDEKIALRLLERKNIADYFKDLKTLDEII